METSSVQARMYHGAVFLLTRNLQSVKDSIFSFSFVTKSFSDNCHENSAVEFKSSLCLPLSCSEFVCEDWKI